MQEEYLTVPLQFPEDSFANQLVAGFRYEGFDRQPGLGGRSDNTHVPDAGQGHVQRSGDRCRAQRQHVNLGPQLFETFFVNNAEPVLFVDDDQPKVLEFHVFLQHPVRADYDVHRSCFGGSNNLNLLFVSTKPAQDFNLYRIGSKAF